MNGGRSQWQAIRADRCERYEVGQPQMSHCVALQRKSREMLVSYL